MSKIDQPTETQIDVAREARTVCIASDNDKFRERIAVFGGTPPTGIDGMLLMTQGVYALSVTDQLDLLKKVRVFSEFIEGVESRWCALPHC